MSRQRKGDICAYINTCHQHVLKHYSISEKEWGPAFCDTVGEPGGHYAKWHKPDIEIKPLHDLIYM